MWLSSHQDSIQFAIKLNAHNINGVKLLLSRNCEIKFKKELHSQRFLADLIIEEIWPSYYFSLKFCGNKCITSLASVMSMISSESFLSVAWTRCTEYCKHKRKYCGRLKNKQGLTLPVLCPGEAIYTRTQKIQNIVGRVTEWRILIHLCFMPAHKYTHTHAILRHLKNKPRMLWR